MFHDYVAIVVDLYLSKSSSMDSLTRIDFYLGMDK